MNNFGKIVLGVSALALTSSVVLADNAIICNEKGEKATIVLPVKCSKNTQYAANELQLILGKITGKKFNISTQEVPGCKIYLEKHPVDNKVASVKDTSFAITQKGNLYLGGYGKNGALYAVYHFLQDELQYRVISPFGDEVFTPKSNITVNLNKTYSNGLEFRCLMTYIYQRNRKATFDFYFRNFQNWEVRSKDLGYLCQLVPIGKDHHSIFKFMPPDQYFDKNPNFYTMGKDGKRVKNKQMCFSNLEMRKIFLANVKKHVATRYKDAINVHGSCYVELSAMDYGGKFCYCPECLKREKQYGTPCGAFFEFLAEISREIKKDYPLLKIATLAYRKEQTEIPPKGLLFPDNFVVIFAPIDDNILAPLDHVSNKETYEHLKKWCQISKNILVWYYPNPYEGYLGPYSALRRACKDFNLMKAAGITGTIYEHDVTAKTNSNFADLESWVLLRLFSGYNDSEALILEYMNLAYGKAAPLMYLYFDELENIREKAVNANIAGNFIFSPEELKHLTPSNLERWNKLFDVAEKSVANDEATLFRIRRVRYELDLVILRRFFDFDKNSAIRLAGGKVFSSRVIDTLKKMKAAKMNTVTFNAQIKEAKLLEQLALSKGKTKYLGANAEDLRFVFFNSGIEDKTAITGIAKSHGSLEFPYGIFAHDYVMDIVGKKIKANWKLLQKTDIDVKAVTPDVYKYYRLGQVNLSSATRFSLTSNSFYFRNAGMYAHANSSNNTYDVYFSLKFEGPIIPGSIAKVNKVYCDHYLLVRKEAKEEKLPNELQKISNKVITVYPTLAAFNKKNTVEDLKAAREKAVFENFSKGDIFFGTYDNKTKANKRIFTLKVKGLTTTNQYDYYKVPVPVKITKNTICYGNNWLINSNVGTAIKEEGNYNLYLSLRIDVENKKVYCDKVLLVSIGDVK